MKNVLITGAGSYIGTQTERYLSQWPEAYRVDTLSVRGDGWREASFRGYDAVVHVAGLVHDKRSKSDPAQWETYRRVNAVLPENVARKARAEGVRQFLFLSSESVYGLTARVGKTVVIGPDTPEHPTENYGRSKLQAEAALRELEGPEFRVAILRPPMVYGRGCKGNYAALSRLARTLPVFPKVENRRSMIYVENLSAFIKLLIDSGGRGTFWPQDQAYVDVGQLAVKIARAHGKRLCLVPGTRWALRLLSPFVGAVDKAFGSLVYDRSLSDGCGAYWVKSLDQAVWETERGEEGP